MCPQNGSESETENMKGLAALNGTPPTEKEKALIVQFREKVKDITQAEEDKSDHFLLRWIRGRDGNLDKAETMLRNHMKWRSDNEIEKCLSRPVDPFIDANYKIYFKTKDKDGRPFGEVHVGSWDLRKAMDAGKEDEFHHFINQFFEKILQCIRDSGNITGSWPHTQFVYLCDWGGYSYSQLMHWKAVQGLLRFGSQYEAQYPEIAHDVYFVNCPSIMPLFMQLLKPLLATKTYQKIHVFGTNKAEWEPIIKGIAADPDKLWTRFGGKRIEEGDEI